MYRSRRASFVLFSLVARCISKCSIGLQNRGGMGVPQDLANPVRLFGQDKSLSIHFRGATGIAPPLLKWLRVLAEFP